jgi:hypothetical protein
MLAITKLGGHLKRNGDPAGLRSGVGMSASSFSKNGGSSRGPEILGGDMINPETGIGA